METEICSNTSTSTANSQPENAVPSFIDTVFGWKGANENPGLTNQTEEDCRQAALKDSKYVAYGYRTQNHPDPSLRKTCFLYTSGFAPFDGLESDKAHKTGCLREGEKVKFGCQKQLPIKFNNNDRINLKSDNGKYLCLLYTSDAADDAPRV